MLRFLYITFFCLMISGCSSLQYSDVCNPPMPLPACKLPKKIGIALVLGAGGARGLAHVGVIEELEEAGIPIDVIVGCSAGSLVGALFADCESTSAIRNLLMKCERSHFVDISLFHARHGLSQGESLENLLKKNLKARTFEQLKIPLFVAATDLCSGELITLGAGDLIPAIKASCAIPVVFQPVILHGRLLVDGAVIEPLPVSIAKSLNAELIIAVPLFGNLDYAHPNDIIEIAHRAAELGMHRLDCRCFQDADVVIKPNLCGITAFEDQKNKEIYWAGRIAARNAIPEILEKLSRINDGLAGNLPASPSSCLSSDEDKDPCN